MWKVIFFVVLAIAELIFSVSLIARNDTLRVMSYNVLYYGNGCQGPSGKYHEYLKTIAGFTNPDILCLVKMASIPLSKEDKYGTAPFGFADSILTYALNAAYPGRYNYCTITNGAKSSGTNVLFYDQRKLGYDRIICSYCNITDFTTYKLYYKDPDLAVTHDTTYLYVIPTHTRSGDEFEKVRGIQIRDEITYLKEHFTSMPNMLQIGDFNSRNSGEPFYKFLTSPDDTTFRFYDPPFYPDKKLSYPANWDHNADFAAFMTTSTRESAEVPNKCGTGGGAKGWYDHIFISPGMVNNTNDIRYIPNSYRTIGNDGNRFRISINNRNTSVNNSAPDFVIEALYQMSNKYPVMADFEVNSNRGATRAKFRELAGSNIFYKNEVRILLNDNNKLEFHFPEDILEQDVKLTITDASGYLVLSKKFKVKHPEMVVKIKLGTGTYNVSLVSHHSIIAEQKIAIR